MPVSDFDRASGVLIRRGMIGRVYTNVGIIHCDRAPRRGLDSHLWAVLKIAVDQTGSHIHISSIDTGKHAKLSRHYRGLAADLWKIGPVGDTPRRADLANPQAVRFARYLAANGFRYKEYGPWGCVLLGPPESAYNETSVDHEDHLHVSISGF